MPTLVHFDHGNRTRSTSALCSFRHVCGRSSHAYGYEKINYLATHFSVGTCGRIFLSPCSEISPHLQASWRSSRFLLLPSSNSWNYRAPHTRSTHVVFTRVTKGGGGVQLVIRLLCRVMAENSRVIMVGLL